MPAIITDRFRIHNSEQFSEAFSEGSGNTFYLGIGRPQPLLHLQEQMVEQTTREQTAIQSHSR